MYNSTNQNLNLDEIFLLNGDAQQINEKRYKNKNIEYFSWLFIDIINFINFSFSAFLLFTFIFSFFQILLGEEFSNNSLEINLNKLNSIYSNLLISCFIISGYLITKKKTFSCLLIFFSILILINFNFLLRQNITAEKSEINQLTINKNCLVKNIFIIFYSFIIIITDILLSSYSIYTFLFSKGNIQINLIDLRFTEIIHELKMQFDTFKMGYNNFLMGLGLHKYIPGILYKLNEYHFNNCTCELPREKTVKKQNEILNKENSKISNIYHCINKKINDASYYSIINSKSTIDIDN